MGIYGLLLLIIIIAAGFFLVKSYNEMRRLAEEVKESFSNISVVTRKKTALINQLMTIVSNYAESEKFVMLKLSDDSVQALQQTTVNSGLMLAEIGRMAQRFPELKSNQQYNRLMDSINVCEKDVQNSRLVYNDRAKRYNTFCTSLPTVLYARNIGFGAAQYLSLEAQEADDAGKQQVMITEDAGRLNELLGKGARMALSAAKDAQQQGKQWIEKGTPRLAEGVAPPAAEPASQPEQKRDA